MSTPEEVNQKRKGAMMLLFLGRFNPFKFISTIKTISFYDAFVEPLLAYYRPAVNNSYWNERRKRALAYRLTFATCLLAIIHSAYLIKNEISHFDQLSQASKNIAPGLQELKKDFPIRIYAYAHYWFSQKGQMTLEEFERALLTDQFRYSVVGLIKQDIEKEIVELGGLVFYQNSKLSLRPVQGGFYKTALSIKNDLEAGTISPDNFAEYRKMAEKYFPHDMGLLSIGRWIDREPENLEAKKRYMLQALWVSRFSYNIDQDTLIKQFYGPYQGRYLGNFHIHRYGDPVSADDLKSSKIEDKFVLIILSAKSFKISWLRGGKIIYTSQILSY